MAKKNIYVKGHSGQMNLRETKIGKITISFVISKNRFFFYLIKLIGIKLQIICSIS